MKSIISILLLFAMSDAPEIITLNEFYSGKGAVFGEHTPFPFRGHDYSKSITPYINQIKRSENILFDDYYNYRIKLFKDLNKKTSLIKKKYKKSICVRKKYYDYYRQYAGYIDKNNDTIIFIRLMNFSDTAISNDCFSDWDKIISSWSGDPCQSNEEHFYINLSQNKINY